jgi:hypothetical protein
MSKRWCLLKKNADEFISKIKRGEIDPEKLSSVSSKERRNAFESFLSADDAKKLNLNFEQSLLRKNKNRAFVSWVEKATGIDSKAKEALKKKIAKNNAERLQRTFSPEENQAFLNEIVDDRLGIGVTREEAETIFKLARNLENAKEFFNKNTVLDRLKAISDMSGKDGKIVQKIIDKLSAKKMSKLTRSSVTGKIRRYLDGEEMSPETKIKLEKLIGDIETNRIAGDNKNFGVARVALDDYVGGIKLGIKQKMTLARGITEAAGAAKAAAASLDVSFTFRQGLPVLLTHPTAWLKGMGTSFKTLIKAFGDEKALSGVRARIAGRENSINGLYDKMKVAVGVTEEAFPSSLPEKIPLLGRFFRASNQAFTAAAYEMRAELADIYIKKANRLGVNMYDKKTAENFGKLVNSLTGRGDVAIGRAGEVANVALFSPKFVQSRLDILTGHILDRSMSNRKSILTSFKEGGVKAVRRDNLVRVEAGENLLKILGLIGGTLLLADKLQPKSVEWDATSSDFGKIRIGDTRFDISGGFSGYITLVERIRRGQTKSSTTGLVTKASDYTGKNFSELFSNFAENKTSPFLGIFLDILNRENFERQEIKIMENPLDLNSYWLLAKGNLAPITIKTGVEAFQGEEGGLALLALTADALGVGANTYKFNNDWTTSNADDIVKFKEKVGEEKFKEQNLLYNKTVNQNLLDYRKNDDFLNLSNDDKKVIIDAMKEKVKDDIFDAFRFKPQKTVDERREDRAETLRKNKLKDKFITE